MSWPTDHIRATLIVFILLSAACGRGPAPAEPGTFGDLDPAVMTLLNELTAAVNADCSASISTPVTVAQVSRTVVAK